MAFVTTSAGDRYNLGYNMVPKAPAAGYTAKLGDLVDVPALHAILPVELNRASGTPVAGAIDVRPGPDAAASPFFFQLGKDAEALPPLDNLYPAVRKRPGATVLLEIGVVGAAGERDAQAGKIQAYSREFALRLIMGAQKREIDDAKNRGLITAAMYKQLTVVFPRRVIERVQKALPVALDGLEMSPRLLDAVVSDEREQSADRQAFQPAYSPETYAWMQTEANE